MARVKLRGFRAIDRRTAAARATLVFRQNLVAALGGEAELSPQRLKLVDMAARAALLLDHVDAWLVEQSTLINRRGRSLLPVVVQRQGLADHLMRVLDKLGLDRVPQRVQSLQDVIGDIARTKVGPAETGGRSPFPAAEPTIGGLDRAEVTP